MIVPQALPGIKTFLKPAALNHRSHDLVVRCVAAFCLHLGRMSAVQASVAVRSEPRQRAQICRFLTRKHPGQAHYLAPISCSTLSM